MKSDRTTVSLPSAVNTILSDLTTKRPELCEQNFWPGYESQRPHNQPIGKKGRRQRKGEGSLVFTESKRRASYTSIILPLIKGSCGSEV